MGEDFKEIYLNGEKNITTLVQEWINENYENLVEKCIVRNSGYNETDT